MEVQNDMNVLGQKSLPAAIDAADWPELSYRLDLTDGLPTFPPQREVVEGLIRGSGLEGDAVIGPMPPSGRIATVRDVAANAAMAGCLPEYMPIVLTALGAMQEPRFNFAGVVATTHPCWPLVIVSGAAVADLGMATGESVFSGGGSRANLAIGRAIKLTIWNVGGGRPHQPVQEIFGHPGRLAFSVAESDDSPWPPFHESRDVVAPDGAVTVFACEGPQIGNLWGFSTSDNPDLARAVARFGGRPDERPRQFQHPHDGRDPHRLQPVNGAHARRTGLDARKNSGAAMAHRTPPAR